MKAAWWVLTQAVRLWVGTAVVLTTGLFVLLVVWGTAGIINIQLDALGRLVEWWKGI